MTVKCFSVLPVGPIVQFIAERRIHSFCLPQCFLNIECICTHQMLNDNAGSSERAAKATPRHYTGLVKGQHCFSDESCRARKMSPERCQHFKDHKNVFEATIKVAHLNRTVMFANIILLTGHL